MGGKWGAIGNIKSKRDRWEQIIRHFYVSSKQIKD